MARLPTREELTSVGRWAALVFIIALIVLGPLALMYVVFIK